MLVMLETVQMVAQAAVVLVLWELLAVLRLRVKEIMAVVVSVLIVITHHPPMVVGVNGMVDIGQVVSRDFP